MSFHHHLKTRALVINAVRRFFLDRDYLEVDTPVRLPSLLPEAHIDPVASETWFLQTSPEQCMKRLLSAGHQRIFQICKTFRKAERGKKHLPEFSMLEWYRAGADYFDLMAETEALVRFVAEQLGTGNSLFYQGAAIDLSPDWPAMTVAQAFERYTDQTMEQAVKTGAFDERIGCDIEPELGLDRPVFLYDYPAATGAAFARQKAADPTVVERFELYIGGLELCNGFSELTGAAAYEERFQQEESRRTGRGLAPLPRPKQFLSDMDRMPDAAGNALGIDRLVMLFCDATTIDDVVAFPPEML
ncbi:EF-P lysine aminoacylase EpmA [Desulfosudis oleivorans]|uniref:tRNA synthetase class II (D K and N) n=1 Tax=Desulfosudis oleivorans (strain DSM 6200 / JCM 39069 / Hxd3) TaxID=96561 RepID=A9A048_DESOH|nr:EF-P lysine aminoacylase EpmA [Desulfosudis oleivorans]ABW68967.1 tRNA synthetase class II (D K and N) [Desulfosudis oleivorans Hxd3]